MQEDDIEHLSRADESVPRDAAWEQAFLAQLTDDLADSVVAFAKKRASWLEGKTKRKDAYQWRELYQDAITDTWTGDVTWDPQKAPLDLHLKRVIRSRTTMMMKHLVRFPRVSAHSARLDLEHEMSAALVGERASRSAVDLERHVDDVIAGLHLLAVSDPGVTRILECFSEGLVDRRDILRATGMPAPTYDSARRRLLGFVQHLPHDLREEAIQAMA